MENCTSTKTFRASDVCVPIKRGDLDTVDIWLHNFVFGFFMGDGHLSHFWLLQIAFARASLERGIKSGAKRMIQESSLQPLFFKSLPVTMPRPYLIVPYSRSRFKHFSDVNHSSLLRYTGMSMKSWYHKKQMKMVMVTILCLYMACCISAIVISIEKLSSDPITRRIMHDSMGYTCTIAWSFLFVLSRCSRGQTRRFNR